MTPAPTPQDVSGRKTAPRQPNAPTGKTASGQSADARRVQTLHDAVEAARRFGLMRENY